jgi:hypothetical protein
MSKADNRARMPTVAAIVDEFRAFLGNGGKVIYASENGHEIGVKPCETNVFPIPPNYRPMWTPEVKK